MRERTRVGERYRERGGERGGLWEGLRCLQTGISFSASHAEFQLKVKQKHILILADVHTQINTYMHTHLALGCVHQRKDNKQNKKHRQKR